MTNKEQEPYAYAYVREDGVGQLCWTKRDTSLFKDVLEGWKEVPLYTKEKTIEGWHQEWVPDTENPWREEEKNHD
jgi:hypothetical protein